MAMSRDGDNQLETHFRVPFMCYGLSAHFHGKQIHKNNQFKLKPYLLHKLNRQDSLFINNIIPKNFQRATFSKNEGHSNLDCCKYIGQTEECIKQRKGTHRQP